MVNPTGYWSGADAHHYHIHSQNLSDFICDYLKEDKTIPVYDFGCGMGKYLKDLYANGYTNICGIEPDAPDKSITEFKIYDFDLTTDFTIAPKGHVICLEVGEHIPPQHTKQFLYNIDKACGNHLILSWAIKGQGGTGHFNELNNDEVIPMFEAMGFGFLQQDSLMARGVIENHCAYFKNTIMIFKR